MYFLCLLKQYRFGINIAESLTRKEINTYEKTIKILKR
jgi:hypothetical protein